MIEVIYYRFNSLIEVNLYHIKLLKNIGFHFVGFLASLFIVYDLKKSNFRYYFIGFVGILSIIFALIILTFVKSHQIINNELQ